MVRRTEDGVQVNIPNWLLAIIASSLLGAVGVGFTTWAEASDDHNVSIPQQKKDISELQAAVSQIKSDIASSKADARATRVISSDTNAKINILLEKALSK